MNSDNMDRSSNKLNKLSTFMLAHIFNNRNIGLEVLPLEAEKSQF